MGTYVTTGDGILAIGIQGNTDTDGHHKGYVGDVYLYDAKSRKRLHVMTHLELVQSVDRLGYNYVRVGDGILAVGVPHGVVDSADRVLPVQCTIRRVNTDNLS